MVIFPNLVINDNVGFTVRVIEPTGPNSMRINAWAFAPKTESPRMRALRLDNFVSFLGPAGFGSADDVEMLELCQRGLDHAAVEWNELSKGMTRVPDYRLQETGPARRVADARLLGAMGSDDARRCLHSPTTEYK